MDLKEKVKKAIDSTGNVVKSAGETIKEVSGNIANSSSEIATKVIDSSANVVKNTGENIKDVSGDFVKITGETASKIAGKTSDTIKNTKARFKKDNVDKEDSKKEQEKDINEDKSKKINLDEMLKQSIENYNINYTELSNNGSLLYTERERSVDLLDNIENIINSIANKPKSFDADINFVHDEKAKFRDVCEFAKQELEVAKKTGVGAAGGVATAATVASLAPSAALWVATTFGTASTGTAISTLSGAAAISAKLAWLGGGALSVGGGGMAAGNALLALAGPIGWTIAGASILTTVTIFATNKTRNNKQKKEEIEKVKSNLELVRESTAKTKTILNETNILRENLSKQYTSCVPFFGKNFLELESDQQQLLGTLVNNSKSLSATLEKTL